MKVGVQYENKSETLPPDSTELVQKRAYRSPPTHTQTTYLFRPKKSNIIYRVIKSLCATDDYSTEVRCTETS